MKLIPEIAHTMPSIIKAVVILCSDSIGKRHRMNRRAKKTIAQPPITRKLFKISVLHLLLILAHTFTFIPHDGNIRAVWRWLVPLPMLQRPLYASIAIFNPP